MRHKENIIFSFSHSLTREREGREREMLTIMRERKENQQFKKRKILSLRMRQTMKMCRM